MKSKFAESKVKKYLFYSLLGMIFLYGLYLINFQLLPAIQAICYDCQTQTYDTSCVDGSATSPEYRAAACPYPPVRVSYQSTECGSKCGLTEYCSTLQSETDCNNCGNCPTATPTLAPQPTATPTLAPQPTATPTLAPQPTATSAPTATTAPTATPTSASTCPAGQNRVNCNNTWFTCCTGSTGYCTLGADGAANGVSCTAPPTATPIPAAAATSAPAATATPVPAGGCVNATAHCDGDYTACCPGGVVYCTADLRGASCSAPGGEYGGGEYGGGEYTVEAASMTGRTYTTDNQFYRTQICARRCQGIGVGEGSETQCDDSQCVDNTYEATFGRDYVPGTDILVASGLYSSAGILTRDSSGKTVAGVTPYPNDGVGNPVPPGTNCTSGSTGCYVWPYRDGEGNPWVTGRRIVHFILANPTPTLYPTVVIQGSLKEYLGGSCSANVSSSSISLNLNPVSSSGITVNCGVTPPAGSGTQSTYRCAVAFNNQTASPTPAQNFTLSASASSYSPAAGWFTGETNSCTTTSSNTLTLDVAAPAPTTSYSRDIFFDSSSRWVKLKDASFAGTGSLSNNIPLNLSAYDSDDSAVQRYFIMTGIGNDPGAVVVDGTITLGTAQVSEHQWKAENNGTTNVWTRSSFYDYIKSRKSYTSISSLSDISANGIYYYSGLLPLNWTSVPSQLNTYKVVLIVPGQVDIDVTNFNPTQSFALIADTINFNANVQSVTGLFVAASVTTGDTSNQGLKITGNLIARSSLNNQRDWTTNTKPSVFIVFDPNLYLNLLDILSVATYDWRQLQ